MYFNISLKKHEINISVSDKQDLIIARFRF